VQIATASLGIIFLAGGVVGFFRGRLNLLERGLLLAAGLMMVEPTFAIDLVGIALGAALYARQRFWKEAKDAPAAG
jgi:TRAP-type uncharacterized transport system fused permease subunit